MAGEDEPDYMDDLSAFLPPESETGFRKAKARERNAPKAPSGPKMPWQERRKMKLEQRKEKERERREKEEETLKAGLAEPIGPSNIGFKLLQKMGYSAPAPSPCGPRIPPSEVSSHSQSVSSRNAPLALPVRGEGDPSQGPVHTAPDSEGGNPGLGRGGLGSFLQEPVPIELKRDRLGLGRSDVEEEERQRRKRERRELEAAREAQAAAAHRQFGDVTRTKWERVRVRREFNKAASAVLHLMEGTSPHLPAEPPPAAVGEGDSTDVKRHQGEGDTLAHRSEACGEEGSPSSDLRRRHGGEVERRSSSDAPSIVFEILAAAQESALGSVDAAEATAGTAGADQGNEYDPGQSEGLRIGPGGIPSLGLRRGLLRQQQHPPLWGEEEEEELDDVDAFPLRVPVSAPVPVPMASAAERRGWRFSERPGGRPVRLGAKGVRGSERGAEVAGRSRLAQAEVVGEEEDAGARGWGALLERVTPEVLSELRTWLRTAHCYCVFCGHQYPSAEALSAECPGLEEDDH